MLSDAELRVLRALAEALIPPGGPFPLGAGDVGTAERLARYLQRMAPETQGQVRLLLRAWEAAPLASRHLRRFSRLAPAARDAWVERCLTSRLPWRRIPLLLLKTLCLSAFCADPRVEAALGYGHECLDGRAPGAGPRLVPLQYPDVRGDVEEGRRMGARPVPWGISGRNAEVFEGGVRALGLRGEPMERNIVGCRGCGECAFGCPSDAKRAMHLTYLPAACAAGARLYARCRVERMRIERGRAAGIEAGLPQRDRDPLRRPPRLHAPLVLAAPRAIHTPGPLARRRV